MKRDDIVRDYLTLRPLCETVDDLEGMRTSAANRLRMLTSTKKDKKGRPWGLNLPKGSPDVVAATEALAGVKRLEKAAVKYLELRMSEHPLAGWIERHRGLGYKGIGRLLGAIGNPAWQHNEDRPRTLDNLYGYCAMNAPGGIAPHRTKGMKSNWSSRARMRLFNVVGPIFKNQKSEWRSLYDEAKAKYKGVVHAHECLRCGTKAKNGKPGKPAKVGSKLKKGHIHARALRIVGKAILKDLWLEARRVYGLTEEVPRKAA